MQPERMVQRTMKSALDKVPCQRRDDIREPLGRFVARPARRNRRDRPGLEQEELAAGEAPLDVLRKAVAGLDAHQQRGQRGQAAAHPGRGLRLPPRPRCTSRVPPGARRRPCGSSGRCSPSAPRRVVLSDPKWSTSPSPLTTDSPRPKFASTIISPSSPLTGLMLKPTPATSQCTICWTTTAIAARA